MMDIDKQLQTHLDALMQMEKPEEFGPAFVQRQCRIGYNNACHVLERGVDSGLLIQASVPYRYKLAHPCWACLVEHGEEPYDGMRSYCGKHAAAYQEQMSNSVTATA